MAAVNVRAPLLLLGAVIPAMRRAGGGSIINLSSVSGVFGTLRRSTTARPRARSTRRRARSPRSSDQTTSASTPSPGASSIPSCGPTTERSRARSSRSNSRPAAAVVDARGCRGRDRVSRDACRAVHHGRDDLRRRRHGGHARPLQRRRLTWPASSRRTTSKGTDDTECCLPGLCAGLPSTLAATLPTPLRL
jgi:hypothetical protein